MAKVENQSIFNSMLVKWLTFYRAHFPTDEISSNIMFPVVALIISVIDIDVIDGLYHCGDLFLPTNISYGIITLHIGVAYQLYYGFTIGDRKQYTPWIIIRLVEIILLLSFIIFDFATRDWGVGFLVVGCFSFFINCLLAYKVIWSSTKNLMPNQSEIYEDVRTYEERG